MAVLKNKNGLAIAVVTVAMVFLFYLDSAESLSVDNITPKVNSSFSRPQIQPPIFPDGRTEFKNPVPYQLSIRHNGSHICSGVILDKRTALTAASCFTIGNMSNYTVVAGEQNLDKDDGTEQVFQIQKVLKHPKYETIFGGNDIAVIHIKGEFNFTDTQRVNNIWISSPKTLNSQKVVMGTVTGWGKTRSNNGKLLNSTGLRSLEIEFIKEQVCKSKWPFLKPSMFCGYNKVTNGCEGDSGSPLTIKNYDHGENRTKNLLVGISSFGPTKCEEKNIPTGFTNVSQFYEWIVETRSNDLCSSSSSSFQFQCFNGQCINEELKCNKKFDCEDGSDEKICPSDLDSGFTSMTMQPTTTTSTNLSTLTVTTSSARSEGPTIPTRDVGTLMPFVAYTSARPPFKQHYTIYGQPCIGECGFNGYTASGCEYAYHPHESHNAHWDYCSVVPGTDYYGNRCKSDSPCGNRHPGSTNVYSYSWCWLEKGSWGYCSPTVSHYIKYFQYKGPECISPCLKYGSKYMCYNSDYKLDSCSRFAGLAVNLDVCTSACDRNGGHPEKHGASSYNWCYTELEGSASWWNYCSIPQNWFDSKNSNSGRAENYGSLAKVATTPTDGLVFLTKSILQGRQTTVTTLRYRKWNINYRPSNKEMEVARECVENWIKKGYPTKSGGSSTILTCQNKRITFRLDQQKQGCGDTLIFAIQTGGTVSAQVQFPYRMLIDPNQLEFNPDLIADALLKSLETNMGVEISINIFSIR